MKTLALLLLTCLFGSKAYSATVCTYSGEVFGPKVTMTLTDSVLIHVYGTTRNTHLAEYAFGESTDTRTGESFALLKVADHSTWEDMPQELELDVSLYGNQIAYYLSGPKVGGIRFSEKDCHVE